MTFKLQKQLDNQLKWQSKCQVKIKFPDKLILQIESSRDTPGLQRDIPRGNISGITGNESMTDTFQVTSFKSLNKTGYTPTNVLSTNPINIPSETLRRDPTFSLIRIHNEQPSSNLRYQSILYPYAHNKEIQKKQVSLQGIIILFILHIILYLSSRQRYIEMLQLESRVIHHIRAHTLYCEIRPLFSSTKSWIYNKE